MAGAGRLHRERRWRQRHAPLPRAELPLYRGRGRSGGIGASSLEAEGDVFNLRDLRDFPGTYGQARYGGAVGTASAGELWLQNQAGVIMRLRARRTGLMLSLGGDAVVITMTP